MTPESSALHIGKDEFQKGDLQKSSSEAVSQKNIIQKIQDWLIDHSGVSTKERVTFFRLLATMINAGLPLTKALGILQDQGRNAKMKKVCGQLREIIEMGKPLSEGMYQFPNIFESSQIGMLHSGEVSGKLNQTLLQVADQMEASAKIKGKIKGAMMYPMAIVVVLLGVVGAVTVLVIPQMKETFAQGGAKLPAATQLLIEISEFLTGSTIGIPNWGITLIAIALLVVLIGQWKKTKEGKWYWNKFIFLIPIFGELNRKVALARFCRGMATLLKSGISITKALSVSSDIVGSEIYRRRILLVADDVSQGISIAENMKGEEKTWPAMLVSMVGVGEKTAQLENITSKLAEFYEEEVDNTVKNLSSLMEPIIILLLGGVVGFLVVAIMSPIMQLSEVATA